MGFMSMMKRYNFDPIYMCMSPDPKGEYVRYEDVPKWVSVEERLPEYDTPVLVVTKTYPDQLGAAILRWEAEGWYWEEYSGIGMDFRDPANYERDDDYGYTHWQPLPPPPGDDDD
jgi:hypothetical protein